MAARSSISATSVDPTPFLPPLGASRPPRRGAPDHWLRVCVPRHPVAQHDRAEQPGGQRGLRRPRVIRQRPDQGPRGDVGAQLVRRMPDPNYPGFKAGSWAAVSSFAVGPARSKRSTLPHDGAKAVRFSSCIEENSRKGARPGPAGPGAASGGAPAFARDHGPADRLSGEPRQRRPCPRKNPPVPAPLVSLAIRGVRWRGSGLQQVRLPEVVAYE